MPLQNDLTVFGQICRIHLNVIVLPKEAFYLISFGPRYLNDCHYSIAFNF